MNIPSSPLKENLIAFFKDCEEILTKYDLQDFTRYKVKYKFTRQEGLSQDCKSKIEWIFVKNYFEEDLNKLKSISPCMDNLIEYFGLIYNTEKIRIVPKEYIENSRNWRKRELVNLFFNIKNYKKKLN